MAGIGTGDAYPPAPVTAAASPDRRGACAVVAFIARIALVKIPRDAVKDLAGISTKAITNRGEGSIEYRNSHKMIL